MLMVGKVVNFGQQFCTVLISRPQSFNYMQIHKTVVTYTFFDFVSFTACAQQAAVTRVIALSEGKTTFTMRQQEQ